MKIIFCLFLLSTLTISFQIDNPKPRLHISSSSTASFPNGCGGQAVIAKNFFQVCTQQTPDNMYAISGCVQNSMNGYYFGQQWQSAILETTSSYSMWVSAINECLVQQKPFGSSEWDYYAWRVQ